MKSLMLGGSGFVGSAVHAEAEHTNVFRYSAHSTRFARHRRRMAFPLARRHNNVSVSLGISEEPDLKLAFNIHGRCQI